MKSRSFKQFVEFTDIFGFDHDRAKEEPDDNMLSMPIRQFNLELMMDLLSQKKVGDIEPFSPFINEMRWGWHIGSVKLEVDTGWTFYVKKLGRDLTGAPRWVTKRMFQLNRQGYGGEEDIVSHEIHEYLKQAYEAPIPRPDAKYDDLENLVQKMYNKALKTMKDIFLPEGIRKVDDSTYILKLGVRGQGVQEMDQRQVTQNQTTIHFDEDSGLITITNCNLTNRVGAHRDLDIGPKDLDLVCFPSQGRDEISELLAVHLKYY